ncbi:hypothetical protein [Streptomyces sp. KL116D]|uniref:hypothetical protein n=1 Tax=Streptomyces sp. KL116D TaxID=3045152 RepID=UPI003557DEBD
MVRTARALGMTGLTAKRVFDALRPHRRPGRRHRRAPGGRTPARPRRRLSVTAVSTDLVVLGEWAEPTCC